MKKKILLTGGGGLLGQYLNLHLSSQNLLTLYYNNPGNCLQFNSAKLNLTDVDSIKKTFDDFKPDIVVHTAAVSRPEIAEKMDHKEVYSINVGVTHNLALLCAEYNSRLIYTSTDLVYAGYRGQMLKEDAKLIPVSLYAETKLMGEVKVKETFDNYIILRTCLLYGMGLNHSENNFHKMYFSLKNGKTVNLFTDQYRTPLSLFEAARIINKLCELDIKKETFNFGGKERVNRFELGEILCEESGLNKELLNPVKMKEIPGIYKVEDVSLNCDKLDNLGIKRLSVRESVREILKNL